MIYPPIFEIIAADGGVTAELGTDPVRFWPFGLAPEHDDRPYAVHQAVFGTPENTLACTPDIDHFGIQVDIYARTVSESRTVAETVRDALEGVAHWVAHNGETWEPNTGLFRISLTFEFWTPRTS